MRVRPAAAGRTRPSRGDDWTCTTTASVDRPSVDRLTTLLARLVGIRGSVGRRLRLLARIQRALALRVGVRTDRSRAARRIRAALRSRTGIRANTGGCASRRIDRAGSRSTRLGRGIGRRLRRRRGNVACRIDASADRGASGVERAVDAAGQTCADAGARIATVPATGTATFARIVARVHAHRAVEAGIRTEADRSGLTGADLGVELGIDAGLSVDVHADLGVCRRHGGGGDHRSEYCLAHPLFSFRSRESHACDATDPIRRTATRD